MSTLPDESGQRSREACPRCSEHRLSVLEVPDVRYATFDPANSLQGIRTDFRLEGTPGIVCLACGAEWLDLPAFRTEQAEQAGQGGRSPTTDQA